MVSSETIVFEGIGAETNAGPLEDLKTFESKYLVLFEGIVVGTLTSLIKGHARLFFSRKKSSLPSDFHVID